MYYLKDTSGNILKIADSEKAFINSVFEPGGTCAGYIEKTTKHRIDFVVHNRRYCLNKYGVILSVSKKDRRNWYQLQLQFEYKSEKDFRDSLAVMINHNSHPETVYFYNVEK